MRKQLISKSKFLSLVLRHAPEKIGLELDEQGWASVAELIDCAQRHGTLLNEELIREIVATNDKKRFVLTADGSRIRANQGHSIAIELGLSPVQPPDRLFHGTATRFLDAIRQQGLVPGSRRHVHLSKDQKTATTVGARHGKPVVLVIRAAELHAAGQEFFLSENGVWLTTKIRPDYLEFP